MHELDYSVIHPSWRAHIQRGLQKMDARYLENLTHSSNWLPDNKKYSMLSLCHWIKFNSYYLANPPIRVRSQLTVLLFGMPPLPTYGHQPDWPKK